MIIGLGAIGTKGDTQISRELVKELASKRPDVKIRYMGPASAIADLAALQLPNVQFFELPQKANDQLNKLESIGINNAGSSTKLLFAIKRLLSIYSDRAFLTRYQNEFLNGLDVVISSALTTMLNVTLKEEKTQHVVYSTHPVMETPEIIFPILPLGDKDYWSRNAEKNIKANKWALTVERLILGSSARKMRKIYGKKSPIAASGTMKEFEDGNIHLLKAYPIFIEGQYHQEYPSNKIKIENVGYPYIENKSTEFAKNAETNNEIKESILKAKDENRQIVFVSFGSMSPSKYKDKKRILAMLAKLQELNPEIQIIYQDPTLKNKETEGKLRQEILKQDNQLLYTTAFLNYGALLPEMDAMISHFGIGSLQEAMRAGIRTLSLAFISEQIWTGNLAKMLGIGLEPHYIKKMTAKKLNILLRELLANQQLDRNAKDLSKRINNEIINEGAGVDRAYIALMKILGEKV